MSDFREDEKNRRAQRFELIKKIESKTGSLENIHLLEDNKLKAICKAVGEKVEFSGSRCRIINF